ncbi:23S rRNA (adenine(2030)-N(6))-methyltransferase RlmJ [Modicisalibacter radicis]|uniref:23S rRNA (adenine(2030)-N(6))-methyltransferase RlmJ n=1 Tax=Halomonas sp. EAR18 TaxID=2518972 RepID=UPI00109C4395|nr:23S rRNA (adenine(2030)-N(6))-methyltransferase RlmJ [Halomonas sp. EAR18]
MLAYQHAYHAGNFADVHKHLALFSLTRHLLRKKSSVTYIDTHAGRGLYRLAEPETQKLKEYESGVGALWAGRQALSGRNELLDAWLAALQRLQPASMKTLSHYPGSPWWLAQALRSHDRLSLFELHPGEHGCLEGQPLPGEARRIHGDGLAGLQRVLPVATPRLCVLVDPSYERKAEYLEVAESLRFVARKVRHAVVMVWYPLLPAGRHAALLEAVRKADIRKVWRSEFEVRGLDSATHGMYGSGLLVLNPPWGLGDELESALDCLMPRFGPQARQRAGWWVAE